MSTAQNVRYVYFWVHPQWSVPWDSNLCDVELECYRDFVERIRVDPLCALVQVEGVPQFDTAVSREWVTLLRDFDKGAAGELGSRYYVFRDGFFNGCRQDHVGELASVLGLHPQDQSPFVTSSELEFGGNVVNYLARIFVFGKELDTCPLQQAYHSGLHDFATSVRYYSRELPDRIDPAVNHHWDRGDRGSLVGKR